MGSSHIFVFSTLAIVLFSTPSYTMKDGNTETKEIGYVIGALVDESSRIGREEKVAMEIAKEIFNNKTERSIVLHTRDTQNNLTHAIIEANDLITKVQVQAILGPQTWEVASLVAKISTEHQVPILSFADASPKWASQLWPFLIQASPDRILQMKAIAEIVQSWDWHQVTLIHEDMDPSAGVVITRLSSELRKVGAELRQVIALPRVASSLVLSEELKKLKKEECRVFVVHLSLPLAVNFFETAKEMEMMEVNYVWITTDLITSLLHSLSASSISSMIGVVGVMSHFPEAGRDFQDFSKRFRRKFRMEYPDEEDKNEPGIYAVQAYDTLQALANLMNGSNQKGEELLERILISDFDGLLGNFQFINRTVAAADKFQIINVVARSCCRELGIWSNGLGFSKGIGHTDTYNSSMRSLGQVIWPGDPLSTPTGWTAPANSNPLRIGVPAMSGYKEYCNVEHDNLTGNATYSGFSIDVFKAIHEKLPFDLPYEFIPYENGTYENLVKEIHLKKIDAVVGDVAITASRYDLADWTHPFTDTGLVMIVPAKAKTSNRAWLFMKPYTTAMWVLIVVITIYNGFVVWLIERNESSEHITGSKLNQLGILLSLSFTTLFSLQGERLHSNLSRMSLVVWLFVALIITQTYTANLTSMLTVEKLEPTIADVDTLIKNNAIVGACIRSFMDRYLVEVVDFPKKNIRTYASHEEYFDAFKKKKIAAAFMEEPVAKVFLEKYCKERFIQTGPSYKVGGFGFAFARGSQLLHSINEALLQISESGKLLALENAMMAAYKCTDKDKELESETPSLSPQSFMVLFIFTGGTSTLALVIFVFRISKSAFGYKTIWKLMENVLKHWNFQMKYFNRRVSPIETESASPPHATFDPPSLA